MAAPDAPAPPRGPGGSGGAADAPLAPEVLARVRARDPEAMGQFFDRYFDLVFGFTYRLLGDRTAAEDVTQEVFYKVYRAADQMDAARDPRPWLFAIARNACRDVWRSASHRMSRRSASIEDETGPGPRLAGPGRAPEGELLARERERLVQEAIERLPEPLRVAVMLHDYAGLSHQEVAAMTGIEHAAARKRYSRALAALGRMLKDSLG